MRLDEKVLIELLPTAVPNRKHTDFYCTCPLCHKPEHFGIAISTKNHPWRCLKCDERGTIFRLLKILGRVDLLSEIDVTDIVEVKSKIQLIAEEENYDEQIAALPNVTLPLGWKRVYRDEYLDSRGFGKEDFQYNTVGITKLTKKYLNYIIFPITYEGEIKGYLGRHIWDKDKIKEYNNNPENKYRKIARYKNSEDEFSMLVGGIDECIENVTTTAILVEGVFDKTNVTKLLNLYYTDEMKALYSFGKTISPYQFYLMKKKGIKRLIMIYDPDAVNYTKQYAMEAVSWGFKVSVGFTSDKDCGEMNEDELYAVLDNLEDPINFTISKVQKKVLQ